MLHLPGSCVRSTTRGAASHRKKFLVSSTASDSHTWNLVFLQLLIEEYGHEVHNLGACVTVEQLVDQCQRLLPDVLVMSSVNGHGYVDASRAIHAIRAIGSLRYMRAVIGGKLNTRGQLSHEQARGLLDSGFDAVYAPDASSDEEFRSFLQALAARSPRS